jgi:hypothetical protein
VDLLVDDPIPQAASEPRLKERAAMTQQIEGSAMSLITAEIQAVKDAHRKTWASGDYARIAELAPSEYLVTLARKCK